MQQSQRSQHGSDRWRPAARLGTNKNSEDAQRTDVHWRLPHISAAADAEMANRICPAEGPLSGTGDPSPTQSPPVDAVTDAVLTASRLLVGVSARSIAAIEESITVPQFRMLVVLYTLGPMKPSAVAEILHVNPSNITRMVHHLVSVNMVERRVNPAIRREVVLELTKTGQRTVVRVTMQQHRHIADIVERMPDRHRSCLVEALEAFNVAGGQDLESSVPDNWI